MKCPLCQSEIADPQVGGPGIKCENCGRTWEATGDPEMPIRGRSMRVRMTRIPQPGDTYTDVVKPVDDQK